LHEHLNTVRADSFNELVNLAISQEDCIVAHRAEEEKGTNVSTLRSNPEVQDCFPQSEQRILAAGRQMSDQTTSAAAAASQHPIVF
jgi:hypothetical protein